MQNKPHAPTDGQNGEQAARSRERETERQRGRQRAGTKSGERSGTEQRGRHPLPREPREQIRNHLQEIKNLGREIPENCTGIRSGEPPAHISKRQRDPGQTSKGNRSENRESITGTTCKGAGHGREIPEPIRAADTEEPARGRTGKQGNRCGRDREPRQQDPGELEERQRQQHRPKRGQQGTPIREPCNGWEILAENRRKSP